MGSAGVTHVQHLYANRNLKEKTHHKKHKIEKQMGQKCFEKSKEKQNYDMCQRVNWCA